MEKDKAHRLLEVASALADGPADDEPVTEQDRRRFHKGQPSFANNGKRFPVNPDGEPLSDEDRHAVSSSREYFSQHPEQSASFEELAAECGFTMDQIRGHKN